MTRHVFEAVERFVVGTVGPPGSRVFFLQARSGARLVSVSVEKVHVQLLAERLDGILGGVAAEDAASPSAAAPVDNDPLAVPIEDEFRVQALALLWDAHAQRVRVECHDQDPDEAEAVSTLAVSLTIAQVREFIRRATQVVAAGRPPCPFCGQPLDPEGHLCPRANGYRR